MPLPTGLDQISNKLISIVFAAATVLAYWWWAGAPVTIPPSPLAAGQKLYCVSYAPFRGDQTPLDPTTVIPAAQIEDDLARLATLTDCVRIYSVDLGLEQVPGIAERHGLKVLLGIWISSEAKRNDVQIRTGVALANRFPNTVRGVVVGNEVLLRGEMTAAHLESLIRTVRDQVKVPVTYADVWEFWTRNPALSDAVDFVTVHILPYWEDLPIPADRAGAHIASIHSLVAKAFPGKQVLIGEAGWPSAGRMREGALPSRANQARVVHDLLTLANDEKFQVNLIEAFDQPWKRHLEGTVGGFWGLFTQSRRVKFTWGDPVSNHPWWRLQALAGMLLALGVIGFANRARRGRGLPEPTTVAWLIITVISVIAGAFAAAAVEAAAYESLGAVGWLRSVALVAVSIVVPAVAAAAVACGIDSVAMARIIGPSRGRTSDLIEKSIGWSVITTSVLAVESALGLGFNPRYLDFPVSALTCAIVPLLLLSLWSPPQPSRSRAILAAKIPAAETAFAVLLFACAIKIVWFETFTNWQAVWTCAAFVALAFTLVRARDVRG